MSILTSLCCWLNFSMYFFTLSAVESKSSLFVLLTVISIDFLPLK
jgi:hypothetical protein